MKVMNFIEKGFIVCVDDQPEVVNALLAQLENAVGEVCDIEIAESAEEALDVIEDLRQRGERVDVVLTDEIMPGMQGSKLLEIVHQRDPNIMTAMLTGQAGVDDIVYAINHADLNICIKKPWDYGELKNIILDLLERAKQHRLNARLSQDLVAEKNKAEAIIHSIADGILVINGEDQISLVNEACTKILGRSEKELLGARILDILELKELLLLFVKASQHAGEVISDEIVLQYPGQKPAELHIVAIARTLRNKEGQLLGIVAILRDITKEKELTLMKTNFLSTISHELRTPLTSILSTYELLLQESLGALNGDQRDFIADSKKQAEFLSELINNLIDLTNLEANQFEFTAVNLNIAHVAREAAAEAQELAAAKGVQFLIDIEAELPVIIADEHQMTRLIKHLLSNAIKFTERGEITVNLRRHGEQDIQLAVSDTGIGISQEYFEHIFEKFFQVDNSSTREFSGSGLGLSICRAIVQSHHGRIWVESTLNSGTTFYVTLPITPTIITTRITNTQKSE